MLSCHDKLKCLLWTTSIIQIHLETITKHMLDASNDINVRVNIIFLTACTVQDGKTFGEKEGGKTGDIQQANSSAKSSICRILSSS